MREPEVTVGILSDTTVNFKLIGIYSAPNVSIVSGDQTAMISGSGISLLWNGKSYTSLEFTPTSYDGDSFEIEGVTIGIDFHWERKENQRFRGSLRLVVNGGRITVINVIKVEDYLTSVISSEMKATSSLPLLRAHAVISRSWLLKQMQSHRTDTRNGQHESRKEVIRWWDHEDHELFNVCADDHCQRYQGISKVSTAVAANAVADTRGQVLMYDGEICDTRFSKCCGGVFERYESCWDDTPHPYLIARRDDAMGSSMPDLSTEEEACKWIESSSTESFCNTDDQRILSQVLNGYDLERKDFYRWTEEYSQEKLSNLIKSRSGFDLGPIIDLRAIERGSSGRIVRLHIVGTTGEITIGKELMIRRTLSESHLMSSAFTVERHFSDSSDIPTAFTFHGAGWGHGVGLCQIGAAVMGEKGYAYDVILLHYYPGTTLVNLY